MVTYQYKCLICDHRFEEFQLITESPIEKCPKCGGSVKRIISGGAGFLFKGPGFYITDYRSDSYKKAAAKDKPEPAVKSSTESKKKNDKPQPITKTSKD